MVLVTTETLWMKVGGGGVNGSTPPPADYVMQTLLPLNEWVSHSAHTQVQKDSSPNQQLTVRPSREIIKGRATDREVMPLQHELG